ncbi:MAG: hypothetical protein P4L99_27095 [Chthoniobacter sp.]|nr:hypothetical protein [Chthoniobacter sp.]
MLDVRCRVLDVLPLIVREKLKFDYLRLGSTGLGFLWAGRGLLVRVRVAKNGFVWQNLQLRGAAMGVGGQPPCLPQLQQGGAARIGVV